MHCFIEPMDDLRDRSKASDALVEDETPA